MCSMPVSYCYNTCTHSRMSCYFLRPAPGGGLRFLNSPPLADSPAEGTADCSGSSTGLISRVGESSGSILSVLLL
jgi:hypothetical protein